MAEAACYGVDYRYYGTVGGAAAVYSCRAGGSMCVTWFVVPGGVDGERPGGGLER